MNRPSLNPSLGSKHILLVDDAAMMTGLIATFLTQRGHRVATAKNGIEVLEKLKLTNYDLVLSDVQVPICDGYGIA